MSDKQKERLYKAISNWNEFIGKVDSQQDILLEERIKVSFDVDSNLVEISFPDGIELISVEEFDRIRKELHEQRLSDISFQERLKNTISDMEFKINHETKTFFITEKYVTNLIYGSDISSAQGWYIRQLKEVVRLFEMRYKLYYNDQLIESKDGFENAFLKGLYKFVSIDKTIEEYEEKHGTLWYEKPSGST